MKILNSFCCCCCCVCVYIYIYNLSNKKCVYIIKKCAYVYIYVCGSCLDKYISLTLGPQTKITGSALGMEDIMCRRRLHFPVVFVTSKAIELHGYIVTQYQNQELLFFLMIKREFVRKLSLLPYTNYT